MQPSDRAVDTPNPENQEAPVDDASLGAIGARLNRVATLLAHDPQRIRDELTPLLDLDVTQSLYLGEPQRRLEILAKAATSLGLTREELSILIWAVLRNRESSGK